VWQFFGPSDPRAVARSNPSHMYEWHCTWVRHVLEVGVASWATLRLRVIAKTIVFSVVAIQDGPSTKSRMCFLFCLVVVSVAKLTRWI